MLATSGLHIFSSKRQRSYVNRIPSYYACITINAAADRLQLFLNAGVYTTGLVTSSEYQPFFAGTPHLSPKSSWLFTKIITWRMNGKIASS